MSPGQRPSPADPGKAGCPTAPPLAAATADHPAQKGHPPEPLNQTPSHTSLSPLPPGMIRSRTAASRAPAVPLRGRCAPHDPPARSQDPAAIRAQGADPGIPRPSDHDRETPEIERLRSPTDAGKAVRADGHGPRERSGYSDGQLACDAAQRADSGAYRAQSPQTADSSPTVAYARLARLKTVRTGSRGLLGLALCRTIT